MPVTPAAPSNPARYPELLMERGLVSADNLSRAQAHAAREQIELADALIALALTSEAAAYDTLAAAAGTTLTPVELIASSELAVQLVPERFARRHGIVPLAVDNRTLSYATCLPFSLDAERDLSFASGRRTAPTVATRSAVIGAQDRCYPAVRPGMAGSMKVRQSPPAAGRVRILVTDDDRMTRMMARVLLEREHYEVLEAANGDQALAIAVRERPGLVLMDLNMPIMDGYQSIHYLRQTFTMADMPIIVLTAEDGHSTERHVLELGANDYIVKPVDPVILLSRVVATFGRQELMAA